MTAGIITLTTDLGLEDAYVAAMKGVILSTNPNALIIDISHSIEPQNILQGAFILNIASRLFPQQSIHIAVVDPGVGSERQGIILKTPSAFFVAPDNGILSYIIDELSSLKSSLLPYAPEGERVTVKKGMELATISDPRFWQQPVCPSFHGRDIFAPVAAGLSLGISMYEFGEKITSLNVFPLPKPCIDDQETVTGQILHVDHFGNLITNVKKKDIPRKSVIIEIRGHIIHELSSYYAQREGLIALMGSSGYLEISLKNGSAREFLNAVTGDEVRLFPET